MVFIADKIGRYGPPRALIFRVAHAHICRADPSRQADALALAREAARRVDVPFLVVDIAQDVDGRWWVIECNDGQESGYGGASPVGLWQRVVDLERTSPGGGGTVVGPG